MRKGLMNRGTVELFSVQIDGKANKGGVEAKKVRWDGNRMGAYVSLKMLVKKRRMYQVRRENSITVMNPNFDSSTCETNM